jgi:hypothetical protein
MGAIIRVLNAQNVRPIEIYRQIIAVYGKGVMIEVKCEKVVSNFNEGRINVHDEERSGPPSLISENLKKQDCSTHQDKQAFSFADS